MKERVILHADLDAFFASVEMLDDPTLEGRPVIVGGIGNRGVVATANYEARKSGVHSAMPTAIARRCCPHGVFLPPRMRRYEELSREVMSILREITPLVEQLSVDEAFFDVTGAQRRSGSPQEIAESVRAEVRNRAGLPVSIGGGSSKLIAKMATEDAKPDGICIVALDRQQEFLDGHVIRALPGLGPKAGEALQRVGIHTILDARRAAPVLLDQALGAVRAAHIRDLCEGRDDRVLETERDRKSIGHEETFASDLVGKQLIEDHLFRLVHEATRRARLNHVAARTAHLKIRNDRFQTITRSITVPEASMDPAMWWPKVQALLHRAPADMQRVRLLGVSFSQLSETALRLFESDADGGSLAPGMKTNIPTVVDAVRDKFGADAIGVARLVRHRAPDPDRLYGPLAAPDGPGRISTGRKSSPRSNSQR